MEQVFAERSLFKIGRIPFFTKASTISYGLYCFSHDLRCDEPAYRITQLPLY